MMVSEALINKTEGSTGGNEQHVMFWREENENQEDIYRRSDDGIDNKTK